MVLPPSDTDSPRRGARADPPGRLRSGLGVVAHGDNIAKPSDLARDSAVQKLSDRPDRPISDEVGPGRWLNGAGAAKAIEREPRPDALTSNGVVVWTGELIACFLSEPPTWSIPRR